MKLLNFESQNLMVDWISFNIQGLPDPGPIASDLSKHFTPHVFILSGFKSNKLFKNLPTLSR